MTLRHLIVSLACCASWLAACSGAHETDASASDGPIDSSSHDALDPRDALTGSDARDASSGIDAMVADDVTIGTDAAVEDSTRPDGCAPPVDAPVPGMQTARPKGSTCAALGYYEYVPPTYASTGSTHWPLIIAFHGDGQRGNGTTDLPSLLDTGLTQQIQRDHWDPMHRFVVLAPQMDDRGGMLERTGNSVRDFITFALAHYNLAVHPNYLTGLTGGGAPS